MKPQKTAAGERPDRKGQKETRDAGLSEEERDAVKERVRELRAGAHRGSGSGKGDGERDVRAKIAEMQEPDRTLASRIDAIVKDCAPDLEPRTWYGMPAYGRDGSVICFFQSAQKFKSRYATLGFSDKAWLDDGEMWPTAYAVRQITSLEEARIRDLIGKAVRRSR